jgi:uncharacterized RDD family membrane protein YckC
MSDLPPPPPPPPNVPPPPPPNLPPPPGYVPYGQHLPVGHGGYAGFWIRFGASLLDGLIIGVATGLAAAMFGADDTTTNLLNLVVGVVYFGLLEGGPTGQTLGKRVCGIRVVDAATGQPGIGVGRGIGRYFARWLSAIPLGLGYFWMLWDERKQTWHDKIVSSVVVRG